MTADQPKPPREQQPRRVVAFPLLLLAALLVLFEEFVWVRIARLIDSLSHLRLFARLERWMLGLTPRQTLALFAVPLLALVPVKILAFYLLAHGQVLAGVVLIVVAKGVGTAVSAKLLVIAKPKLLTFPVFVWAYAKVDTLKQWARRLLAEFQVWQAIKRIHTTLARAIKAFRLTFRTYAHYGLARGRVVLSSYVATFRRWWRRLW
ncbi:MAG: hypothetical protein HQL66_07810 [Magnetococcales bacterium]|nr:hypothetical protein [Magnetococcales bacterium]